MKGRQTAALCCTIFSALAISFGAAISASRNQDELASNLLSAAAADAALAFAALIYVIYREPIGRQCDNAHAFFREYYNSCRRLETGALAASAPLLSDATTYQQWFPNNTLPSEGDTSMLRDAAMLLVRLPHDNPAGGTPRIPLEVGYGTMP